MSRQPSPTASGEGQGPGAGPYVSSEPRYLSVSLDCAVLESEIIFRGSVEVALLECGESDFYVGVLKDGEVYRLYKTWDEYRVTNLLDSLCRKDECNWEELVKAAYAIFRYQKTAEELQKNLERVRKGILDISCPIGRT